MTRSARTNPTGRPARLRRALAATALVGLLVPALAVGGATSAMAAPAQAKASAPAGGVGTLDATVETVCEGNFGTTARFKITSQDGIPAGSKWTVSTTDVGDLSQFYAMPDTTDVSWRAVTRQSVELTAQRDFAPGEAIRVDPSGYSIDWTGVRVQISGYGGAAEMSFVYRNNVIRGTCLPN